MRHAIPNPRVAACYGAGAALAGLLAAAHWPWTAPALWPCLSLALLTAGYLGAGPAIYGKHSRGVPLWTRILMAPALLGQHLSLRYYRSRSRLWDEALPGVLMGRTPTPAEADLLRRQARVTAVLDLTAEFTEPAALRGVTHLNLPMLDLTRPTPRQMEAGVDFIRRQRAAGAVVYVHCKVGYSRTAAVVGAYLMATGRCRTADDAAALLRAARPGIVIRPEAMAALREYEAPAALKRDSPGF